MRVSGEYMHFAQLCILIRPTTCEAVFDVRYQLTTNYTAIFATGTMQRILANDIL